MTTDIPSLPSFSGLPFYLSLDAIGGYLCGKLNHSNAKLAATVFAIRALTHTLFFQIANFFFGSSELRSQKVFLVTTAIVNLTFVNVLRELQLISRLFFCLFGIAMLGQLYHRVSYIDQQQELLDG